MMFGIESEQGNRSTRIVNINLDKPDTIESLIFDWVCQNSDFDFTQDMFKELKENGELQCETCNCEYIRDCGATKEICPAKGCIRLIIKNIC